MRRQTSAGPRLYIRQFNAANTHLLVNIHVYTIDSSLETNLPYIGISGEQIGGFRRNGVPERMDWFDYGLPQDLYVNANPKSYLQVGYEAVRTCPWRTQSDGAARS